MTVSEAIAAVRQVTGQVVSDDIMRRWLSELDGRLAAGFFGCDYWRDYSTPDPADPADEEDEAELTDDSEETGTEGSAETESTTTTETTPDTELLIPHPWDGGIYFHWLAAQTYLANGEYDRYENERVYAETQLDEFRKYLTRTLDPACKLICEWTRAARPFHDGGARNTNWMED